jgi:uncharacterized protein with HEPN domain
LRQISFVRDDLDPLRDIPQAIDNILGKTAGGRSAFDNDEMLRVWVLHHLQIIGEAARALSSEFRQRHPDKVWTKAAGMRNILMPITLRLRYSNLEGRGGRHPIASRSRQRASWRTGLSHPALS